jgi:hypothetical protein
MHTALESMQHYTFEHRNEIGYFIYEKTKQRKRMGIFSGGCAFLTRPTSIQTP